MNSVGAEVKLMRLIALRSSCQLGVEQSGEVHVLWLSQALLPRHALYVVLLVPVSTDASPPALIHRL